MPRPRPQLDASQIPAIGRLLAQMEPQDELAYRLALAGMFTECRQGEWDRRRSELMIEIGRDEDTLARCLNEAQAVAVKLESILAG